MRSRATLTAILILFLFLQIEVIQASDGSITDQFLGNPLLVLVALFVLVGIAFVYHWIRK